MTPRLATRYWHSLESAVTAHSAIFMIGVSWAFGGNADWVRTPISAWGSLGMVLTLLIAASGRARERVIPGTLTWALPVLLLNLVVGASCLTPGLKSVAFNHEYLLMPVRIGWWIPSAARPGVALRSLWLFDGFFFSGLNIALAVSRKGVIRILLAVLVANALALSIFGTVQKLIGSTGIYFGAVKSPQDYFFASFVYDNHWGAFMIIMLGAAIGLVLRYAKGSRNDGFFHGPAFAGVVAASLMAITVPLSGSRACTLQLAVLLAIAIANGTPRISRALKLSGASSAQAAMAMILAAVLVGGGIWMVAGDVIHARAAKTREQVAAMWAQGGIGSRGVLYHDTWRMARERLLFGWGMGSFPTIFGFYNTQESKIDRIPVVYHDAHSDWLQSVAEIGLAGTTLIGCTVLLPIWAIRRKRVTPIPYFLFIGLALVSAYAWVEFPFGNVAVVLAWWLCFFCSIQYIRLSAAPEAATLPSLNVLTCHTDT